MTRNSPLYCSKETYCLCGLPIFLAFIFLACSSQPFFRRQACGRLDMAKRSYLEAVRVQPGFAIAWSNLAGVCKEEGDLATAVMFEKNHRHTFKHHVLIRSSCNATFLE